jgi:hypothetical protein
MSPILTAGVQEKAFVTEWIMCHAENTQSRFEGGCKATRESSFGLSVWNPWGKSLVLNFQINT